MSEMDGWYAQECIPAETRLFSNGTEHEMWMGVNCCECRFFDPESIGSAPGDYPHSACVVEYAVCMHGCGSPMPMRLAEIAGLWPDPGPGVISSCSWRRGCDEGDDDPRIPPPDPNQLDLLDPRHAPTQGVLA